ncbi:FAD-dependent oxidoreductase [uncultured Senegalimassilia sp.]|uniref:L-aspartate oxidase n=1 Tax=uncultured Senegalimassilia sp. TaxID=1714350 RepID=UPI0027DB66C2|nr:FAD-dependent oxidoreductase [uncultured Senegalimassilia sp.]
MSEANELSGDMGAVSAETAASAAACASNTSTCAPAGDRLQPECDGAAEVRDIACDVVIVGCGVAGLYCALNLPSTLSVVMLAKTTVDECDSMLAQGGICVQHDDADYAPFFEDTLRAGHYENRCESVDQMIRASRSIISDLVKRGVDFERDQAGNLRYTREGAHSRPRICFHSDITGDEITSTLLARVRELPNVRILEHTCMNDILIARDDAQVSQPQTRCRGVLAHAADGAQLRIFAGQTLWACGGIGGTYPRSTNFPSLTGDACAIAARHGIALEHMDYVQIHPTSLYSTRPGRAFLVSESCRGEGAVLLDANGNRFTDELQPRDVVSAAIYRQMAAEGSDYVRLSFANMPKDEITGHFKNIYQRCLEEGFDITREPIPVVPAQHYFMGGVRVDRNSATDMPGLYAAGETSCNGVHGKNRLASNSLLESLVFAQRAAWDMCRKLGVKAPVKQTYPEQPCGADAQAYRRLCAEAERKTREGAAKCGPQNTTQTCAQNVGQTWTQSGQQVKTRTCTQNAGQNTARTESRNAGQPGSQTVTQTCPQNPSPSDTDRTASSKEVVCA